MAEQRQPFRFRFPWLSAQRNTGQPQRPRPTRETTRQPLQPTTAIPIQRPAGRATAQRRPAPSPSSAETSPLAAAAKPPSPSAANESPKITSPSTTTAEEGSPPSAATESQKDTSPSRATAKPSSPTRAATETPQATSRLASSESAKPQSQSQAAAETRVDSQPTSPSLVRDQSKATHAAASPSKGDSKSKAPSHPASQKTTSEVSSPSRKADQREPEPTNGILTQSPSSPDKSQAVDQDSSSASLATTQAQKPAPQEEPKKPTSQTPSQEPKPEVGITSETTKKLSSQDDAVARGRTKVSSPTKATPTSGEATVEPVSSVAMDQKPLLEAERESEVPEAKKETTQELSEEEKADKATNEKESLQKTVTEALGTKRDTKEKHIVARKALRRQQKQETSEKKETMATASYIGKQIKTVIPSQPTEGTTGIQKPFSFTEEEESPIQREIKENISKLVCTLTTGPRLDDKPVTVITLTGENRGAAMLVSSEAAKRKGSIHIHRGYKTDPDESTEGTTDGEVSTNRKRRKDQMASAPTAYVNSNVQTVNNSIVFEASVAERSPGVYLSFSQDNSEAIKSNGKTESVQTRKAEFMLTPSEKLTHQPNVRRRCLRGLFMEPSDSDPDNPDKPRRHGCRYSCGETSKDKEIM